MQNHYFVNISSSLEALAQPGLAWEKISQVVLAVFLFLGVIYELYGLLAPVCTAHSSLVIDISVLNDWEPTCGQIFEKALELGSKLPQSWLETLLPARTTKILRDYVSQGHDYCCSWRTHVDKRSGIYYNPFGRKEPVIIRSPEAIHELSEASDLSQRAVYADVSNFFGSASYLLTTGRYLVSSTR
jgi:hypothetical protein